jgi:hypothetical protein
VVACDDALQDLRNLETLGREGNVHGGTFRLGRGKFSGAVACVTAPIPSCRIFGRPSANQLRSPAVPGDLRSRRPKVC